VNECYAYGRKALFVVLVVAACTAAAGNDDQRPGLVVIDTDMGLDDVVGLAIALQDPQLEISAMVAGAGAMSATHATTYAERILRYFNRSDVPLYAPCARGEARVPAERFVRPALPDEVPPSHQPFSPAAYTSARGLTKLLALGPLTNLAAALDAQPQLKDQIQHVIVPGVPDVEHN
jgi:purine nucleosidase